MRIVGGKFRGVTLTAVGKGDVAAHLRPTTDRVRENIFNLLSGGRFDVELDGAHVLDLFAGTGALGLEALSRGAAYATFVDQGRKAAALISDNIAKLGVMDVTRLIKSDATRVSLVLDSPCNLVFLDPPYGSELGVKALMRAASSSALAPGAIIVWEDQRATTPPVGFRFLDARKYGDSYVTFLQIDDLADRPG
ncbi:MAG: 16S rRNA (guanine(966)-N(2))-methyltransferase RsmD [Pseudomonadota bacterium]